MYSVHTLTERVPLTMMTTVLRWWSSVTANGALNTWTMTTSMKKMSFIMMCLDTDLMEHAIYYNKPLENWIP